MSYQKSNKMYVTTFDCCHINTLKYNESTCLSICKLHQQQTLYSPCSTVFTSCNLNLWILTTLCISGHIGVSIQLLFIHLFSLISVNIIILLLSLVNLAIITILPFTQKNRYINKPELHWKLLHTSYVHTKRCNWKERNIRQQGWGRYFISVLSHFGVRDSFSILSVRCYSTAGRLVVSLGGRLPACYTRRIFSVTLTENIYAF